MASRKMLTAVNRELRTMPDQVQHSATAVLAQELAREYDVGRLAAASQLMRALAELRKMAAPSKVATSAPQADSDDEETPTDELDELARARAARIAAAAGVVRSIGADVGRAGGRQAR